MRPKTIIIDFDGVLTDGKQPTGLDGNYLYKDIHSRDVMAIRELLKQGYEVIICTSSTCRIIPKIASRIGATLMVYKDKAAAAESFEFEYIAIGDSVSDLPLLQRAALAYCPADASVLLRSNRAIVVLETPGGMGCIEELMIRLKHDNFLHMQKTALSRLKKNNPCGCPERKDCGCEDEEE